MSDMTGKICMVTGATSGVGKVTARELARMGAAVIVVGRSRQKGEQVVAAIKSETGAQVELLVADLSAQAEIRRLADEFKRRYDRLDVLVNNAGAIFMARQTTADGLEMTFALNHLNYFLLTHLLLDTLKASAPARIVNVSSHAHYGGKIAFDNLQGERRLPGWRQYNHSKLANVLFTYELARRLAGAGVTANAVHPGVVRSGFGHNNGALISLVFTIIQGVGGVSEEAGADTVIYLASSPEVEGVSGQYFYLRKPVRSSRASYDVETARRLWEVSEQLTGITAASAV